MEMRPSWSDESFISGTALLHFPPLCSALKLSEVGVVDRPQGECRDLVRSPEQSPQLGRTPVDDDKRDLVLLGFRSNCTFVLARMEGRGDDDLRGPYLGQDLAC